MRRGDLICIMIGWQLVACQKLETTLGKKSSESRAAPSSADSELARPDVNYKTWNSLEDSLNHLDDIKKKGADALLELYHADGRQRIRMGFRRFREAILRETQGGISQAPWLKIDDGRCVSIDQHDIFDLGEYGDLRGLLGTAFLGRLKMDQASSFNAELPPRMDELTKLAFFEFGVALEGESTYSAEEVSQTMRSDVRWKVIHEQGDAIDWQERDQQGVQFSFMRSQMTTGGEVLTIEASAGRGVYEGQAKEAASAMTLSYQRLPMGEGKTSQSLHLQKGRRLASGAWDAVHASRRVMLLQDLGQGNLIHFIETINYGMDGEYSRRFRIDINKGSLCAGGKEVIPVDPIGNNPKTPVPPPGGSTPPGKGEQPDDPGQNDDNPSQNDDPSQNL